MDRSPKSSMCDSRLKGMEKGDSSKEESHEAIPKNLFWSLVSQVRDSIDIDFNSSCSVVRLILDRLGRNCPSVEQVMDEILQQESTNHFDEVENNKGRVRRLCLHLSLLVAIVMIMMMTFLLAWILTKKLIVAFFEVFIKSHFNKLKAILIKKYFTARIHPWDDGCKGPWGNILWTLTDEGWQPTEELGTSWRWGGHLSHA